MIRGWRRLWIASRRAFGSSCHRSCTSGRWRSSSKKIRSGSRFSPFRVWVCRATATSSCNHSTTHKQTPSQPLFLHLLRHHSLEIHPCSVSRSSWDDFNSVLFLNHDSFGIFGDVTALLSFLPFWFPLFRSFCVFKAFLPMTLRLGGWRRGWCNFFLLLFLFFH